MRCLYCKRKCAALPTRDDLISPPNNRWKCRHCYGKIDVTYETEPRDDRPISIELFVPYKKTAYHIKINFIEKTTNISVVTKYELLFLFDYAMDITPRIAEDKLKTILVFC